LTFVTGGCKIISAKSYITEVNIPPLLPCDSWQGSLLGEGGGLLLWSVIMPKLGDITTRDKVGLAGRSKIIWAACPECGKERWVMLSLYKKRDGKVFCPPCIGRRTVNQNNLRWWNEGEHKEGCQCARCADQWGENNPSWNGGVSYQGGYKTIKIYPDNPYYEMADGRGYVMEHRLVIAEKMGRVLDSNETVHHINGIKDDNRLENLEVWWGNHGKGVRVKDMLASWAKLYDFHCECCKYKGENNE